MEYLSPAITVRAIGYCASLILLVAGLSAPAFGQGQELNAPPDPAAIDLVERAVLLAESDRPSSALVAIKNALSISPNYLRAHLEYRNIRTNFLDQYDEVETEYQSLIRRFPNNPVYLMAVHYRSNATGGREALKKVVALAPEWAWGHYAGALLIKADNPEVAASELQRCIEKDRSATEAYELLIGIQEKRLHRVDDAIQTAERFAAQTDIRASVRLPELWRLRLVKARQSEEATKALRDELSELTERTSDVDVLMAIRSAYLNLVNDGGRVRAIEDRIVRLDPSWTPQRGWVYTEVRLNQSKVPRYIVHVNRQIAVNEKVQAIVNAAEKGATERIRQLETVLGQKPSLATKRIIYEEIFQLAVRSNDSLAVRKYGNILYRIDPDDSVLASRIVLVLANTRQHLAEALYFARRAYGLTSQFRVAKRPLNTPQSFFDGIFSEQKQRLAFETNRALALDALGWLLVQMNQAQKAEPLLRQAVEKERSESRLWHLAKALQKLGRLEEAAAWESESRRFLADSLRRKFTTDQISDLRMESIEGGRFNLSDLKGKVVVINFWATWCVPCIQEIPSLQKLYEKYEGKGFEVLAVSTDNDSSKIRSFLTKNKLSFSILHDPGLREKLGIEGIPANLFIDRQGRIRYRKIGFEEGDEREFEVVIIELLK